MLALDVGKLSIWLLVSLLASLAALAVALGIFAAVGKRANRRLTIRLAVAVGAAAIIVPVAVIVIYTQFINDPPPKFDENDLSNLVSGGGSSDTTG